MGRVGSEKTPKRVGRWLVPVLAVAGLLAVAACGIGPPPPPTAPATAAPASSPALSAPVTTPARSSADELRADCTDLTSEVDLRTLQLASAITADHADGTQYRTGVALAYDQFALRLSQAALMTGNPQLGASLLHWSSADHQIAGYVLATIPSGDNLVELGPGIEEEKAARSEAGTVCNQHF